MNSNSSPLVSIIVPAYNHEKYIESCIKSIINQSYDNIELIVIDDGSTDSTKEKIKSLKNNSKKKFQFIAKENEGLIKTLNLGLKLAKGKYFAELASDDILPVNAIEKRVLYMEENPDTEAVFTDATIQNDNINSLTFRNKKKLFYSNQNIKNLVNGKSIIIFPTGLIVTKVLQDIGGFDEDFKYFEDIHMELLLALRGRIGHLDCPTLIYRVHDYNTSAMSTLHIREEKILSYSKLLELINDEHLREIIKNKLYREYWKYYKALKASNENLVDKKSGKFKETLISSLKLRPFYYKSIRIIYHLMFH